METILLSVLLGGLAVRGWAADTSALSITIGDGREITAPKGSATAGSKWIEFDATYKNVDTKSVWVAGHSPDQVFLALETRTDDKHPWVDYGMGYCGVGAGKHEIKPGTTRPIKVALPEKYRNSEFRVLIDYSETADGTKRGRSASEAGKVVAQQGRQEPIR